NAREVSRDNAEAELFGSKPAEEPAAAPTAPPPKAGTKARTVEATATPGLRVPAGDDTVASKFVREDLSKRLYDPSQLESGVVLNAAVILNDPKKIRQTIAAIEETGRRQGLPLKAISWQEASGLI